MAKKAASRKAAGAARKSSAARKKGSTGSRKKTPAGRKKAAPGRKKAAGSRKKTAASRKKAPKARGTARKAAARRGGAKRAAPRRGTNPFPTKRSTNTPAGAGTTRQAPALDRARRHLRDVEESMGGIPSSLDLDRHASAARTGRAEMREARRDHPEVSPDITGGDVDADWEGAYATGDEAPGGDNMTPDQDRVDDIGKALGVQYEDNEELKGADKIASRDKKRWELDPASSDDYKDRE